MNMVGMQEIKTERIISWIYKYLQRIVVGGGGGGDGAGDGVVDAIAVNEISDTLLTYSVYSCERID